MIMKTKNNRNKEENPLTFRCPLDLKSLIDRKVVEKVLTNSTVDQLYKYTRTDLILDSIKQAHGFVVQED